jgi:hypothetical protein
MKGEVPWKPSATLDCKKVYKPSSAKKRAAGSKHQQQGLPSAKPGNWL